MQQILHRWRPDLTVLESDGPDRCADRWCGQARDTIKSDRFTGGWHRFHDTHTHMYFAGVDIARGWNGIVVDGAIGTGITTARRMLRKLTI